MRSKEGQALGPLTRQEGCGPAAGAQAGGPTGPAMLPPPHPAGLSRPAPSAPGQASERSRAAVLSKGWTVQTGSRSQEVAGLRAAGWVSPGRRQRRRVSPGPTALFLQREARRALTRLPAGWAPWLSEGNEVPGVAGHPQQAGAPRHPAGRRPGLGAEGGPGPCLSPTGRGFNQSPSPASPGPAPRGREVWWGVQGGARAGLGPEAGILFSTRRPRQREEEAMCEEGGGARAGRCPQPRRERQVSCGARCPP